MTATRSKPLFDSFIAAPKRVPWTNAYLMCLASRLAYFPSDRVDEARTRLTLAGWGLRDERLLSVTVPDRGIDTQAFVATNRGLVFLVFRGTEPNQLRDWVSDAKIRQRSYPKAYVGRVHRGFAEALQPVWRQVIGAVRAQLAARDASGVVVAGHSLGGALATLAAQRLHVFEKVKVAGVYTYGCPRVGDLAFRAGFLPLRRYAYRFENNNDVVPKVPPHKFLGFTYEHVCDPHYFRQDGIYVKNPGLRERAVDIALGGIHALLEPGVDGIEDHGLDRYGALIKAQVSSPDLQRRLRPPWPNFW